MKTNKITKELFLEKCSTVFTKRASKIFWKILNGEELTLQEKRYYQVKLKKKIKTSLELEEYFRDVIERK